MGSCASSLHKNAESGMGIRLSMCGDTKINKGLVPSPAPLHQNPVNGGYPVSAVSSFKDQSSRTPPLTQFHALGSKDETFFDTQAWLESDCDEDFLSVNGDFTPSCGNTPSRGNTPNGQISFLGTQRSKSLYMVSSPNIKPKPSPTDKKKKLFEFFKEKFEVDEDMEDKNKANGKLEIKTPKSDSLLKSTSDKSYISGATSVCSSERTPSTDSKPEKQKLSRTAPCCLPSLVPSRKSSDKKSLSPEKNGGE